MQQLKLFIKTRIKGLIELLPYGRDIYLSLAAERLGISYRGVFKTMSEAKQSVKSSKASEYDVINQGKARNEDVERKTLENFFYDTDYPLLYWLRKTIGANSVVIELGGSIGHFFYTTDKFEAYPSNIQWTIAELPEAVKLGQKIAEERNEKRLNFMSSNNMSALEPADIFITAGTIQYMEEYLPELLKNLKALPSHVVVHNSPMHENQSYWTLQSLGACEVPYHIYSKEKFLADMVSLGYKLYSQWNHSRALEIPFHADYQQNNYLGFYFIKDNNMIVSL